MRSSRIQRTLVSLAVLVACATSRTSATLPLDGTYWLTELNGKPAVTTGGSDQAHLRFVRDSALVSGGTGCNRLSGTFRHDGTALHFPPLATTQMACDPALMDQDAWLSETFSGSPTLAAAGDELTVTAADGSTITFLDAVVAEPAQPLEGTRWVVDGLLANQGISTVPIGAEASITINDGIAAVEAGCNAGSATVDITDTTITFGPLALTRMACGPEQTELENAVVAVLAGEVAYTIESDTLELRTTTDAGEIGLNLIAS